MAVNPALERIYHEHHATRRGDFFLVNGEARGAFLKKNIGTGKRVLDIGCRDGALTAFYAAGNDVTGLDIDSAALARAKEKLGIATIQADLNGDWPVEPGFDVVVACEIIEHLYYPVRVFAKIAAVLGPEGVLLGTVPNAFSLRHRLRYLMKSKRNTPLMDPTHINHFTVAELAQLLEPDFTDVRIEGLGRLKNLATHLPQAFAHGLAFYAKKRARI